MAVADRSEPMRASAERRIVVLRHGETAWNAEHRFTTRSDVPLSDAGEAQARAAARMLAGIRLERVLCSPAQRARRTAELALERADGGPAIRLDERLREIDAGPFEGLTPAEIEAGPLAEAYRAWHTDGEPRFPDGAETFAAACARAVPVFEALAREPGTSLVVTHGSLARLVLTTWVIGADPARHRRLWLDNCHFAVVDTERSAPRLVAFNTSRPG